MAGLTCEKCDREFKEDEKAKAYVWEGKTMCDECLFTMGADPSQAMTWMAFIESQGKGRPERY